MRVVVTFFMIVIGTALAGVFHWSYKREQDWVTFYEVCGNESQSPINIKRDLTQHDESLQELSFNNYESPALLRLRNTGHSVQIEIVGPEVSVSDGGLPGKFVGSELHFHWGSHDKVGSEHMMDGHSYPMEMHIVHYRKSFRNLTAAATQKQGLVVMAFFFEISRHDNPALDPIIKNLHRVKMPGSSALVNKFSIESILPENKEDFYRYDGSLTTPMCLESVIWTIFKDTIKISSDQLALFRALLSSEAGNNFLPMVDNTRHIQETHGRVVRRNFEFE